MSDYLEVAGVDFHCHLDLYPDHEAAIARAEAARIFTLTVTTTPRAWTRNHELTRGTRFVRAALGLHPQLVAERADEVRLWESHLQETRYVGEVGLDAGPRFYASMGDQKRVFQRILERCAEEGNKILTVHSVRSASLALDMIERYLPQDRGSVVLHWFSGSKSEAKRAAALGCYFSVNAEMTYSARGSELVSDLRMDRILTETDGPFTHLSGRPSEPIDVCLTLAGIAQLRRVPLDSVAIAVKTNLQALLRPNRAEGAE